MTLTGEISSWNVLIVDDEPDNLNLIADLLEFSGAKVVRAENGKQALALFEHDKPNIILLDLAMPDLDGWAVHRQLRARPDARSVPIIALTGLAMPDDAERVRAAGFDGYITKPFRAKVLLDTLSACVQRFHQKARADIGAAPGTKDMEHA
jgi:two-component system cell cycle response regulator DivK